MLVCWYRAGPQSERQKGIESAKGDIPNERGSRQLIAARAYQLWEEEGRPHGAHERHWDQATREIKAAGQVKPRARTAAKRKTMAVKAGKPAVTAKAKALGQAEGEGRHDSGQRQ